MYVIWTLSVSILHTIPGVHITFLFLILYSCILSKNVDVHKPILAMAAIVSGLPTKKQL